MGRLGRKHGLLYSGSAHTFHLSGLHVQPTSYVGRRSHLTSPKSRPKRPSSGLKRAKFLARGQCTARFLSSARESSRRVFLTLQFLNALGNLLVVWGGGGCYRCAGDALNSAVQAGSSASCRARGVGNPIIAPLYSIISVERTGGLHLHFSARAITLKRASTTLPPTAKHTQTCQMS